MKNTAFMLLTLGAASALSSVARAAEMDIEADDFEIGDLCTEHLSTAQDYVSKTEAQWMNTNPALFPMYGGKKFSDKVSTFDGWLSDGRMNSPVYAIVTPPLAITGTRLLRYVPAPGDPTVRTVAMCEYQKNKSGKLTLVRGENALSQPGNSVGGVVTRSFKQQYADNRVFAVFTRVFHFVNYLYGEADPKVYTKPHNFRLTFEAAPTTTVDTSGTLKITPHKRGTAVPPNEIVDLLQPTDKSEKGPFAAWDYGKFVGVIPLYVIGGTPGKGAKLVSTKTATAYVSMLAAARKAGIELTINSGFRSYGEQEYLFKCYTTKSCNGGNQAGRPGESNHQSGEALDIEVRMGKKNASTNVSTWTPEYKWLVENGRLFGFKRAVERECWHWEYRPETAKDDGTFGSWAALKASKGIK